MQTRLQWKKQIQKIRQPTAYCQACLGEKVQQNDFMLTCSICQASIHKTHYASQIIGKTTNQNHLIPNIEQWKCQRCRYLLEKKFQVEVKCEFCPSPRGIMKKVIFQPVLNNRKEIWVHPQCTTWRHPMIYMKSKKRTHYFKQVPSGPTAKFWFRVEDEPTRKCTLCNDNYGYKIKCSFYSCQKFYHITCAKRIGVVRDLQSMRFQASSDDFCPVYCQQHLQAYVLDFANRIKLYTQKKQPQKVVHFTKVHNCYKIQLKNLTNAAKRSKQQQQIRNQLGKQLLIHSYQQSSMSLSVSAAQSNQMDSSESDSNSSTFLAFLENNFNINDLQSLVEKRNQWGNGQINKIVVKKQSPARKMQRVQQPKQVHQHQDQHDPQQKLITFSQSNNQQQQKIEQQQQQNQDDSMMMNQENNNVIINQQPYNANQLIQKYNNSKMIEQQQQQRLQQQQQQQQEGEMVIDINYNGKNYKVNDNNNNQKMQQQQQQNREKIQQHHNNNSKQQHFSSQQQQSSLSQKVNQQHNQKNNIIIKDQHINQQQQNNIRLINSNPEVDNNHNSSIKRHYNQQNIIKQPNQINREQYQQEYIEQQWQ